MRSLLLILLLSHSSAFACTAFILHEGGRTFVGNNEDSWCVQGRVRFVPGEAGRLGAVYFSSWRGHPYLPWSNQLGMNAAGLVPGIGAKLPVGRELWTGVRSGPSPCTT